MSKDETLELGGETFQVQDYDKKTQDTLKEIKEQADAGTLLDVLGTSAEHNPHGGTLRRAPTEKGYQINNGKDLKEHLASHENNGGISFTSRNPESIEETIMRLSSTEEE